MSANLDSDYLKWAHPLVADWFIANLKTPTAPQIQGWPAILAGQSTLISAPTGSGKTLAAFLTCIDNLIRQSLAGTLSEATEIVYISPLKALNNDIYKNLNVPLQEIMALAEKKGQPLTEIRTAVRTGDTLAKERQAMLKKPPHILMTTPESFYILLTAEKSRAMLKKVKTIIVDEIHVLANNKRGAHLALSLERLESLTQQKLIRIGLSATQKPIEQVGKFLMGNDRPLPTFVNIGHTRPLALKIEVPKSELSSVTSNEMWDEIYDRIAELATQNRATLIFVNTRRLAERAAHHLAERLGEENVLSHHGSLSRKLRIAAETKLKNGELKALVATASLELGIDIGNIDIVCQVGSPRAISVALQRVGRSGHWHAALSKGHFFVTTRDELLECGALIAAIHAGKLDPLVLPYPPLDILAQQLVAACATGRWREEDLFHLVKRACPYGTLTQAQFTEVIALLANGTAAPRGRYGAYLYRDQINGTVSGRRGARLTAMMNGGAIPDNALFTVVSQPQESIVGTLDEDFAVESHRGDIILLGTTSWKIVRIDSRASKIFVENAQGAPPNVPFWRGEAPGRSDELSLCVSNFRHDLSLLLASEDVNVARERLQKNSGMDENAANQLIEYLLQGKKVLGDVPTQNTIIAERFFDESGGMQLIIHAPFGARINKAWGLALRKRFCTKFNFELQAAATDNGITISLSEQHSFPLGEIFYYLSPATLQEVLVQSVLQSPLFTTRWRWVAGRSLALPKFRGGKKVPPPILRMLSEDLLSAVFPDAIACQDNLAGKKIVPPDHPLINETLDEIFTDALDFPGLSALITKIVHGEVNCLAVDSPTPSVFSHEILNAAPYAYLDDAPLEERRARAVEMRRTLPPSLLQGAGSLDPQAIQTVQAEVRPDIRNTDELHDFLHTVIALPCEQATPWSMYIDGLVLSGRGGIATYGEKQFLFAAEKVATFLMIYPDALLQQTFRPMTGETPDRATSIRQMVQGWTFHTGPITSQELSQLFALAVGEIEQALFSLENQGALLRGHYRPLTPAEIEWCERRLLARIHRKTVDKLYREIAPVSAMQFMHWLLAWQHLLPGKQLKGEHGLLEIIKQLQGLEIAANAWEKQIFTKRMVDYQGALLDKLCLSGKVGWGRLSSPFKNNASIKRIVPTSTVPITFFVRDDCAGPDHCASNDDYLPQLSGLAQNIYAYLKGQGASFFHDIVRNVGRLKSEVETGLWELVTAGFITADGFDNLRSLIDRRRRLGRSGRQKIKSFSSGRWAVLRVPHAATDLTKKPEEICWRLLGRYGIVFRDLLYREKNLPKWRELLVAFRRLEDRGQIRGGQFVEGFVGEQFALPEAVDYLRAFKNAPSPQTEFVISSTDPLNLQGIISPGKRVSAASGKTMAFIFQGQAENTGNLLEGQ